jgi:ribose 1,5-bisphosphokinase
MIREQGFLFVLVARSDMRARQLLTDTRNLLDVSHRSVVAHRYTTDSRLRSYSVTLSAPEFAARDEYGCFSFSWTARGHRHAAGIEIDRWLDGGLNVLLHGHKGALAAARERHAGRLRIVLAPAPSANQSWNEVLQSWQGVDDQLPLDLEVNDAPLESPEAAIILDTELTVAARQLAQAMSLKVPPLGQEYCTTGPLLDVLDG